MISEICNFIDVNGSVIRVQSDTVEDVFYATSVANLHWKEVLAFPGAAQFLTVPVIAEVVAEVELTPAQKGAITKAANLAASEGSNE